MSIWSDQAVKELQEKVAWLEKEVTDLKHANAELRGLLDKPVPRGTNETQHVNGTLHVKRK